MKDYYLILGLPATASDKAIKEAFKKYAIQYHPDKNPDDPTAEDKFKLINEAYQTLSDSSKKSVYDIKLSYQKEMKSPTKAQKQYSSKYQTSFDYEQHLKRTRHKRPRVKKEEEQSYLSFRSFFCICSNHWFIPSSLFHE